MSPKSLSPKSLAVALACACVACSPSRGGVVRYSGPDIPPSVPIQNTGPVLDDLGRVSFWPRGATEQCQPRETRSLDCGGIVYEFQGSLVGPRLTAQSVVVSEWALQRMVSISSVHEGARCTGTAPCACVEVVQGVPLEVAGWMAISALVLELPARFEGSGLLKTGMGDTKAGNKQVVYEGEGERIAQERSVAEFEIGSARCSTQLKHFTMEDLYESPADTAQRQAARHGSRRRAARAFLATRADGPSVGAGGIYARQRIVESNGARFFELETHYGYDEEELAGRGQTFDRTLKCLGPAPLFLRDTELELLFDFGERGEYSICVRLPH